MDPNNIPFARSMPLRARMEPASGPMDPADQQGDQTGVNQRMMVPGMQMGVAQQGPRMPSMPANGMSRQATRRVRMVRKVVSPRLQQRRA